MPVFVFMVAALLCPSVEPETTPKVDAEIDRLVALQAGHGLSESLRWSGFNDLVSRHQRLPGHVVAGIHDTPHPGHRIEKGRQ